MCNADIRTEIKKSGLYHWQVAEEVWTEQTDILERLKALEEAEKQ